MSVDRAKSDLNQLSGEADRLRKRLLAVDEEVAKLKAYIEMAQRYGEVGSPRNVPLAVDAPLPFNRPRKSSGGIASRAVEATIQIIRHAGKAVATRELLDHLSDIGIVVGGTNPVANLSGFLSRSPALKNSRSRGWSLAEWPSDWAPGSEPTGSIFLSIPDESE
ncbi:hypothetical protein [Falsiroseomonas sp.]|uniref:hypothetical protein n=1 Tax=Falsiroseomonas sp. TaxID=2870721 RepID=UPI003F6EDB14